MHHHVDWNSVIFLFTNEVSYAFECPWSLRNVVIQVPCHDLVRNIMKLKCYGCHYSNWKQKAQTFSPIFYVGSWGVYDFLRAKWLYNSHASWWSLLGGMQGLRYTQVNETYMANFSTSMKHLEYCYPPSPQVTLQWAIAGLPLSSMSWVPINTPAEWRVTKRSKVSCETEATKWQDAWTWTARLHATVLIWPRYFGPNQYDPKVVTVIGFDCIGG